MQMCALAKFNMWHPELWAGSSGPGASESASVPHATAIQCGPADKQEKQETKGQQAQQQPGWVVANWTFPFQPGDASVQGQAIAAAFLPRDPQGSWQLAGTVQKLVAQRAAAAAAAAAGAVAPSLNLYTGLLIAAGVLLVLVGVGVALARRRGKRRGFRAAGAGRKAASGHDNGPASEDGGSWSPRGTVRVPCGTTK